MRQTSSSASALRTDEAYHRPPLGAGTGRWTCALGEGLGSRQEGPAHARAACPRLAGSASLAYRSKLVLVEAQAVLDLARRQAVKGFRQVADGERRAGEAECPGAISRTGVKVDAIRLDAEPTPDALCDVVDVGRPDTGHVSDLIGHQVVQRSERLARREGMAVADQNLSGTLERPMPGAALMTVNSGTKSVRVVTRTTQRRRSDRRHEVGLVRVETSLLMAIGPPVPHEMPDDGL